MTDVASADFLQELERRRLRALVEGDLEVAEQLHADDYQLITPGGAPVSKREYLDGVRSGALDYQVFEADSEVMVRAFDDVGILRYQARIEIDLPDSHDGGRFWHTDIYERRPAGWQVVWSQATRIPAED
jgi:hypothetical protein